MFYAVLAGLSIFCLLVAAWSWMGRNPLQEQAEKMEVEAKENLIRRLRKLGSAVQRRAPRVLVDLVGGPRVAVMLRMAGSPFGLTPDEYQGLRLLLAGCSLVFSILCIVLGVGIIPALSVLAAGVLLPGVWLKERAEKARKKMRRSLAYFIRQLAVGTAGRVSLMALVADMASKAHRDPLGREMEVVLEDVSRGAKTLAGAMQDLARNIDLPEAHELAAELAAADRFGGEGLAEGLRRLARSLDARRDAEDIAAIQKAEVQVTIVVTAACVIAGSIFMVGGVTLNFLQIWR
ncbi:MAG TPA: hypothetical protein GXX25_09960 [Desulfotomaculum sp.]|nr:hypothetical protein [Desulfotomaculum sp.]